jgi:hypothetical protein
MIGFTFTMLGGAFVTKVFLPDIQESIGRGRERRYVNLSLEKLAPGLAGSSLEKQILGTRWFKEHIPSWLKKRRTSGEHDAEI